MKICLCASQILAHGQSDTKFAGQVERRYRRREGGVVLLIALIVLVALTLAGIALVRSVDTGNTVAGNLAFKQGATLAGDAGTEAAINWLQTIAGSASSYQSQPAFGYYATSQGTLNLTGNNYTGSQKLVDWDFNGCNGLASGSNCVRPYDVTSTDDAGNTVTYIIHRLCQSELDPNDTNNSCVTYQSSSASSPKRGEIKYGDDKRFESLPVEYYRITSRVRGPRNTVSFIETLVHF